MDFYFFPNSTFMLGMLIAKGLLVACATTIFRQKVGPSPLVRRM